MWKFNANNIVLHQLEALYTEIKQNITLKKFDQKVKGLTFGFSPVFDEF